MSGKYGDAVQRADASIGKIISAAERSFGPGAFTLIVTADHGGHDRNHGSKDPRDVTIPWIAWGRGVTPTPLHRPVVTFDTAATALWLLGVTEPAAWTGTPVTEAFRPKNSD
jgi:arylsulfatase A-like enzyme